MGKSGAARVTAHDAAYGAKMQDHEERNDLAGHRRSISKDRPYVYSPYAQSEAPDPAKATAKAREPNKSTRIIRIRELIEEKPDGRELTIMDACAAHVAGAKKSANAKKMFLHGFFQFPTDIKVTDNNQRLFLAIAVDFVDQTYGGNAVFHARIDRDEKGKHGVDVFFAPRYEKHTKSKGVEQWVSLSKFSKENARRRFGKRKKKVKDKKTEKFKPVMGSDGKPVLVWNDADLFQGRALQDAWFEHLQEHVGGKYEVERGKRKNGRDPDRISPEDYAAQQEQAKLLTEIDRQLDAHDPDVDPEDRRQCAAARIIKLADERARVDARKKADAHAQQQSEALMKAAKERAQAEAEELMTSFLSADAREFTATRRENESLRTENKRQNQIIEFLIDTLHEILSASVMGRVKRAFDALWAKQAPNEAPFSWSAKSGDQVKRIHSPSLDP